MSARAALLAGLALLTLPLAAADRDRSAPVSLRADRIDIDQRRGVSRYLGHVRLQQGALLITADRAEARSRGNVLERVVAKGNPATFRDQPEGQTQPVHGRARRLEYQALEQRIELSGDVELQQGRDTMRAGVMRYELASRRLQAERDDAQRVYMALSPRRETPDAGGRR
jgi:lipopolysaccharide export system protein LptA